MEAILVMTAPVVAADTVCNCVGKVRIDLLCE